MTEPAISNGSDEQPHHPRIAVIAVHGVADQVPNETARSVADLLLGVKQSPGGTVQYGHFVETPLRIEVRRLEPLQEAVPRGNVGPSARSEFPPASGNAASPEEPPKSKPREILGSQFAAQLKQRTEQRSRKAGAGADAALRFAEAAIDLQFTSMEIAKYDASLDPPSYESVRLSAGRVGEGDSGHTKVDVYEMYWADLSRLGSGLMRIAGELYQLFFHLSSLGRNTIDLGADANPGSPGWRALRFLHRLCNWTLSVPIGLLNLYLPILVLLLALALVPDKSVVTCAAVMWALLGILACGALMYRASWQPFLRWLAVQMLGLAIGWTLGSGQVLLPVHWLVSGAVLIGFAAAWWLSRQYDSRRPGALVASWVIMLVLGVTLGVTAPATGGPGVIAPWIMRQVELVFVALSLLWTVLICGQILTWCAGEWVIWRADAGAAVDPESPRRLTRRVVWTGRLGFALSSSLFLIVTLSVWAAVLYAISSEKSLAGLLTMSYTGFEWLGRGTMTLGAYATLLLDQSGGPLFKAFFVCVLLSFLMLMWAMAPSVAAEIAPPAGANRAASRKAGFWLDHGFRLARLAGSILVFGLLAVLTTGFVLKDRTALEIQWFLDSIAFGWLYPPIKGLIGESGLMTAAGLVLGGATLGVVALGSRLGKVFVGLRPILDVALDVDNWLKEHPIRRNPKSRILARYSSLLRHVGAYRDAGGRGYDAIVIVAHSQGTVITADLLRYLRAQPDRWPFDENAPVYLLTMGCPLRQLYGLRFPHLYGWARYRLPQPCAPLTEQERHIPDTRQPSPHELGVALWVNAYRSGDYVGRRLWIRDDDPARWDPAACAGDDVASDAPGKNGVDVPGATRIEFCIGSGAHTHYLDETADRVGQAVDQLIAMAAAGKQTYRNGYPVFSDEGNEQNQTNQRTHPVVAP